MCFGEALLYKERETRETEIEPFIIDHWWILQKCRGNASYTIYRFFGDSKCQKVSMKREGIDIRRGQGTF